MVMLVVVNPTIATISSGNDGTVLLVVVVVANTCKCMLMCVARMPYALLC